MSHFTRGMLYTTKNVNMVCMKCEKCEDISVTLNLRFKFQFINDPPPLFFCFYFCHVVTAAEATNYPVTFKSTAEKHSVLVLIAV